VIVNKADNKPSSNNNNNNKNADSVVKRNQFAKSNFENKAAKSNFEIKTEVKNDIVKSKEDGAGKVDRNNKLNFENKKELKEVKSDEDNGTEVDIKKPIKKIGVPAIFQQEAKEKSEPVQREAPPRVKTAQINTVFQSNDGSVNDKRKSFPGTSNSATVTKSTVSSSQSNNNIQTVNKTAIATTTKTSGTPNRTTFSIEAGSGGRNEPAWLALAKKKQPMENVAAGGKVNNDRSSLEKPTMTTAEPPPTKTVSTAKLTAKFQMMSQQSNNQPVILRRDEKKDIPKPTPSKTEPNESSSATSTTNNRNSKVLDLVKNYQKLQVT